MDEISQSESWSLPWFLRQIATPVSSFFQSIGETSCSPRTHIQSNMSSLPVTPAGPVPEGSARKFALLIGIDRYDSYAAQDLEGCVEDVRLVEAYLKATVHIPEANISKLTSPATTSLQELSSGRPDLKSVEAAFTRLASDMKKGDFLYIHYSGHGVRLPTIFTVLKNGNEDEALILLGKTKGQVGYLRDVEMAYLLSKITDRGATVTVVLDCCHSGGAVCAWCGQYPGGALGYEAPDPSRS